MSGHPEAMSQDEDNQRDHLMSLSEAQESMYIVHQVNPSEDNLDQKIHFASDHNEEQVLEMDEFIELKQKKVKSGLKKMKQMRIKREMNRGDCSPRSLDISLRSNKKNFSDAWLNAPTFKHWLQKHPSSKTKAICKVCNKVLLAGKSELLKHGNSKKHVKFMEVTGLDAHFENSEGGSEDSGMGFQDEWLEDPMLKDWVTQHPDSMYKALCKACNKVLLATKTDLIKHRNQKKHKENMMSSSVVQYDEYFDGASGMDTYIAEDNDDDDEDLEESNTQGDAEYTIEEDTEVQGDGSSETPIRVYRVKPTSGPKLAGSPSTPSYNNKSTGEDMGPAQAMVTQPAPHWKGKAVISGHVQEIKLTDYRGRYLVMFFYPQDFSTVCSTEILGLGDVISAFRVSNCEVIAVSVDSHLAHLAWTKTLMTSQNNASKTIVPLLSDSTHAISKAYGCYNQAAGHALRAYYIIDKRGILRSMGISDIQVGRNLKEILRLVEAFQMVDTTNTQCPVNWTMGQPSVKVSL